MGAEIVDLFVAGETQLTFKPLRSAVKGGSLQVSKLILGVDNLVHFQQFLIETFYLTPSALILQLVALNLPSPKFLQSPVNATHVIQQVVKIVKIFVAKLAREILRLIVVTF